MSGFSLGTLASNCAHQGLDCGAPKGSDLEQSFKFYVRFLEVLLSINCHCYRDDIRIFLSMKPEETNLFTELEVCHTDIKSCMIRIFIVKFR